MPRRDQPAVKPLKLRSLEILGLLLVILGALSLYRGISYEGPLWLSWVRGSLAIASGLGLVVLGLNQVRFTQAVTRQPIISRLSHDACLDCTAGVSGGTAAEINDIGLKEIETANSAEGLNR